MVFKGKKSPLKNYMVLILCFILTFTQAGLYIPEVYAAPVFTISPAAISAALLPARVTVTSSEASFTAGSATPYIMQNGSVVKTAVVSNITSTTNKVSFTIGSGLTNGTYSVRIVDPKGTYNAGNLVIGDPSILGISPAAVAKGYDQQTSVTLTADKTNFVLGQTTVEVLDGSGKALNYVGGVTAVASGKQLTFTLKPGLPSGVYSIRAVTGSEIVTGENILTVRGTPSIALSSNQLLQGYGTTPITITGTNTGFNAETIVRILDSADQITGKAGLPTVTNANTLSFSINSGLVAGSYKVKVKTGIEEATTVLNVLSASGELLSQGISFKGTPAGYTAAKSLVFKGTNTNFLQGTSQLTLFSGATDITGSYISGVTISDSNTISFTLATGLAPGTYTAKVTTGGQIVTADFSIYTPTISETTFNSTVISGANVPLGYKEFKIDLVGTNTLFQSGTTVEIQGQPAKTKNIAASDSTHLSFNLAEGLAAGSYTIKVDMDGNGGTTQDIVTKSFTITQPAIASVTPKTIINAGAAPVTITVIGQNTHFTAGNPTIDITGFEGETISNITAANDTKLTFSITPNSISQAGTYGISISTISSGILSEAVTKAAVLTVNASGINSVSPGLLYTDELGAKTITLTGTNTNFDSGNTNVYIDEKIAAKKIGTINVTSTTQLSFTVPAALAAGEHTIIVEQNGTDYETSFVVASRSITLSSVGKVFGYSPFNMTVTGSGITFDTGANKPTVTITGPDSYNKVITLTDTNITGNTVTFPFPTGLPYGAYTVTLSWSGGDYSGIALQSDFNIAHQISGLYIKKGGQTITTMTVEENAANFNLEAYAVMIAGGADQDKTAAAAWSVVAGSDVVQITAGVVDVLKYGKAKIKASYDGQEAILDITVNSIISTLTAAPSIISLSEGAASDVITVTAAMSDGSTKVVKTTVDAWQVTQRSRHDGTDGEVVSITVSDSGAIINGIAAGTAKISVTYGGKTANMDVAVIGIDKIAINGEATQTIEVGQPLSLSASAVKTDGSSLSITNAAQWTSSNTASAVVTAGVVTAKAAGTTTISISYMGKTAQITLLVVAVESVQITGGNTVKIGETVNLQLNAIKSDSSQKDVTTLAAWSSSDNTKATVINGAVKGIAAGTVTITGDYEGKTATKTITVAADVPVLDSITLTTAAAILTVNNTAKVTATAKFADTPHTTQQDITKDAGWQIADPSVIAITTNNGESYIKGLRKGTTTIYVTYNGKQSNTLTITVTSNTEDTTPPSPPPVIIAIPTTNTTEPTTDNTKITTTTVNNTTTETVIPKEALDSEIAKLPKAAAKLELNISKSGTTAQNVTLDAGALKALGDKNVALIIKTEKVNMELPPGFVESGDKLKISIKTLNTAEAIALEGKISKDKAGDLNRLGGIFEFNADLVNDKTTTPIEAFGKKVKITMNIEHIDLAGQNPSLMGVYVYDTKASAWKYVGGKISTDKKTVTFETPHFSAYAFMVFKKAFVDTKGHWAKDYVDVMAARQITSGIDATHFAPNSKVTRGEFAAFIVRALNIELGSYQGTFTDVKQGAWYTPYVEAAAKAGIVSGFDGKYNPTAQITREQMAAMIMRAYAYKTGKNVAQVAAAASVSFGDMKNVSGYAVDAVKAAYAKGIITGTNGFFKPKDYASRGEVAKMIVKLLEVVGE